ncbi:MAG: hypothetical protein R6U26_02280 [Candidatus Undinarchaeales archaeon]
MENKTKIKIWGNVCLILFLLLPAGVSAETDTDADGISDWNETNVYHTNPNLPDTDYDGYSDRMEIFGVDLEGNQMPGYVKRPGDSPIISAYPKIEFGIDNNFTIFNNKEISFENRVVKSKEHTYGTVVTKTTSSTVGIGSSHTTSSHQDVSNKEVNQEHSSEYENKLSSETDMYSEVTIHGKETITEYGVKGEAGVDAGLGAKFKNGKVSGSVGPMAHAGVSASWQRRNSVTDTTTGNTERGTYEEVHEGGEKTTYKSFEQSTEKGTGKSQTFSTTNEVTHSTSVSTYDLHTIGTAKEWARVETQDTSEWGVLRFDLKVSNTGTDKATDIKNLRFLVKIGKYEKTFPFLDEPGAVINNLPPGESIVYPGAVEVPLRLEEIKAIDTGADIEISAIAYDFNEQIQAVSAYNSGVLIQIDDGVSDGKEELTSYLVPVETNLTYLDILKKLNQSIIVKNEPVREISLKLNNSVLHSINNFSVSNLSWWTTKTEGIQNKPFLKKRAKKGGKSVLTYYQDSDADQYMDREEIHRSRDPDDKKDHPAPKLAATPYLLENDSGEVSFILKFENSGDYDAYGIEARLYSPNKNIDVIDEFAGGAVRVKEGEEFTLNDALSYEGTAPKVEILYNDPKGAHRILMPIKDKMENFTSLVEPVNRSLSYSYYAETLPENSKFNWTSIGDTSSNYISGSSLLIDDPSSADNGYFLPVDTEKVPTDFEITSSFMPEFTEHPIGFVVKGQKGEIDFRVILTNKDNKLIAIVKDNPQEAVIPSPDDFHEYSLKYDAQNETYEVFADETKILSGEAEFQNISGIEFGSLLESSITRSKWEYIEFDFSAGDYYESYEFKPDEMIKNIDLISNAPKKINYQDTASLNFVYSNPDVLIEDGKLHLTYFLNGDELNSEEIELNYSTGSTSYQSSIKPSDFGNSIAGNKITAVAVATDHQGVMLAEDVSVIEVNSPLQILDSTSNEEKEVYENESIEFFITAVSEEGQISYQWYLDNSKLSGETSSSYIHTPDFSSAGEHNLSVEISDGTYLEKMSWKVSVLNINQPPLIQEIEDIEINATENITINPNISDPDSDNLTVNISEPIGNDGFWQTSENDTGNYTITVSASDGEKDSFETFILLVLEAEEQTDEDSDDTDNSNDNSNTVGGSSGGGGGGGSYTPPAEETEEKENTVQQEPREKTNPGEIEFEQPPEELTTEANSAPTGLSVGINNKLKATGIIIAGLIGAFIYTLFNTSKKSKSSGPFKSVS